MFQTPTSVLPAAIMRLLISLILLPIGSGIALAQSISVAQTDSEIRAATTTRSSLSATAPETSGGNVDDRLRALEEELRRQNKSLTEMCTIIAEQQRLIESLSAKAVE